MPKPISTRFHRVHTGLSSVYIGFGTALAIGGEDSAAGAASGGQDFP